MKGKKTAIDQIIRTLREVEVLQGQADTIESACRKLSISEQTFYMWRKEYGSLSLDKAKKLKDLEKENARLKKLVADLSLDTVRQSRSIMMLSNTRPRPSMLIRMPASLSTPVKASEVN